MLLVGATGGRACSYGVAKALKLSFAVHRVGERRANLEWRFTCIADGRNYYRQAIENAVAEVLARKVA